MIFSTAIPFLLKTRLKEHDIPFLEWLLQESLKGDFSKESQKNIPNESDKVTLQLELYFYEKTSSFPSCLLSFFSSFLWRVDAS